MLELLLLILIVAGSYTWGELIFRCFGLGSLPLGRLSRVIRIALGLALVASLSFFLGLCGVLYAWTAYLVVFLPLALQIRRRQRLTDLMRNWRALFGKVRAVGRFDAVLTVLIIIMLMYGFTASLAPSVQGDDVSFRLEIAKRYASEHRVSAIADIPESNMPKMMEMLYTMAFLTRGPSLAATVHYLMGLLILAAVYTFTSDRWGRRAALVATGMLAMLPFFSWLSSIAYAELGCALYQLLAIILILEWLRTDDQRLPALAGVLLGIALAVDRSAVVTVLFFVVFFIYRAAYAEITSTARRRSADVAATAWRPLGFAMLGMMVTAVPWYLHGWWISGSPLYPYFPNLVMDKEAARLFLESRAIQVLPEHTLGALVRLPWSLSVGSANMGIVLGPMLLMLIPCILLIERWPYSCRVLLCYAGLFMVCWWLAALRPTVIIPAVAACSITAGWTFHQLTLGVKNIRLRDAYAVLVLAGLLVTRLDAGTATEESEWASWGRARVGFGAADKQGYLSERLGGTWDVSKHINEKLSDKARILMVHDRRGFYCQRPVIYEGFLHIFRSGNKPSARYKSMRDLGVTHILHASRPSSEQSSIIEKELARGYLKSVFASKGVQLLQVQYDAVKKAEKGQGVKGAKSKRHSPDLQSGETPKGVSRSNRRPDSN